MFQHIFDSGQIFLCYKINSIIWARIHEKNILILLINELRTPNFFFGLAPVFYAFFWIIDDEK